MKDRTKIKTDVEPLFSNTKNLVRLSTKMLIVFILTSVSFAAFSATKTAKTGNWSNPATWTPAGVPASTDDVIVAAGKTLTVDGNYTCRNVDLGSATAGSATLKIIAAGNRLTITGACRMNPSNLNSNYTIDAGPGTIDVNGTFSWNKFGTSTVRLGTGAVNFAPAISIDSTTQRITFVGAGTVTFNSDFTDNYNKLTTFSGCVVNFYGSYNVATTFANWKALGTANFYGTGTITHSSALNMNYVNIMPGANTTLAAGAGAVMFKNSMTLGASSVFNMNSDFELNGDLTNNGGSISAGAVTLTMHAPLCAITGTTSLSLPTLQIGSSAAKSVEMYCTINRNTTVTNLIMNVSSNNRSCILASGVTLDVTGDVTLNQPTGSTRTCSISVGDGTLNVNGNAIFVGTNNTVTRVCKINTTSGTFNLAGTITWMSNTAVATEEISTATGTINFASPITMGTKTGTMAVTGTGTINFNGTSAASLTFGGATTYPIFTTAYGSTVKFAKGLTTATTPLTFANGCNVIFDGTATITAGAVITFNNIQINTGNTITLGGNIAVSGNWVNNGTLTPSTYAVTFNGGTTQTITRSAGLETFYKLVTTTAGTTVKLMHNIVVTNNLTMSGALIDLNSYTLTLGNGSGASLTYSAGQAYGGTFKRYWPVGAITATSGNFYGLFPIGSAAYYRPITITSTANPTTAGYVMASHTELGGATSVSYTDNGGSAIQQIINMHSDISTSGLAGGTYRIGVKYSNMGTQGALTDLKLLTYTGEAIGSVGTHTATTGVMGAPIGNRQSLSVANLNNAWVIGTTNKTTTPVFNYVYSRKSGSWNDIIPGLGAWSYSIGGLSCDCLPGASGYAAIRNGHTITITGTDSVKFLDIDTGGQLIINSGASLYCNGDLKMYSSGNMTNNGTLYVTGEVLLGSSASSVVNGNVNVTNDFIVPTGASYTQSTGTLTIGGDIEIRGAMDMGSGASIVLNGSGAHISGTGTFTTEAGGVFGITNNKIIDAGTTLAFGTSGANTDVSLAAGTSITNNGAITINGNLTGANATTSVWVNGANSTLNVTGNLLSTGVLDAQTGPNTVAYNGGSSQTIKTPLTSYYNLAATNAGTKSIAANIVVNNLVTIGGSAVLDESTYAITGTAGLAMSGSSELKMQRSAEGVYPELDGTYTITGGTVTVNQTADSATIHAGQYYNLKLNGTTPYNLSNVSNVDGNLDITNAAAITSNSRLTVAGTLTHSSSGTSTLTDSIAVGALVLSGGTLRDGTEDYNGGQSINITGAGGFVISGGTFVPSDGTVYFSGSSSQSLSGTTASQTFNNLSINKSAGSVSVTGSITTLNINGDLTINSGTFDKGTATAINLTRGNWINNGGDFIPGNGTVTFNSADDQAIQGSAATQTFNNIAIDKDTTTLTVGGGVTSLTLNGNLTLTSGTLDNGTLANTYIAGNLVNNGGQFVPGNGTVNFTGTTAQAITGTVSSLDLNNINVNKSSGTLSVSGSIASLNVNGDVTLSAGTFDKGTATTINAAGNWVSNGGTFTPGTGTVNFNGSSAQAINGSAGSSSFYNAVINKAGSTLTLDNNHTLNIGGNATLTAGTFDAGSATTINLTGGNWTNNGATFTPSTSTVVFNSTTGGQAINGSAASQTFNNLAVEKGAQTLSVGGSTTALNINGNLTITTGTFDKGTATGIAIGGNWTNNGAFTKGNGTVTFNGSTAQSISGSNITDFNNLTVQNTSTGLTLGKGVNVSGAFVPFQGVIHTSSSNLLTLTATATSTPGSSVSYVNGPMKKIGNSDFVFPVGKNGKWRRVGVSEIQNTTTEITGEYFDSAYVNTTAMQSPLTEVSLLEYWDVNRTVTSDSVKLTLFWEDASVSGIQNCDYLTMAHFTGGQWIEEPATVNSGSVCSGTGTGSITMNRTVSTFSPFGFGSSGGSALPIKLVSFDAVSEEKAVKTNWVTSLEINNDYFTVERSTNGVDFTEVGRVDGAGNSTITRNYTFYDENPVQGTSYYRLKQTDYDGTFAYSHIATVSRTSTPTEVAVYPNPAIDIVTIAVGKTTSPDITVNIFDQFGKSVYHTNYPVSTGGSQSTITVQTNGLLPEGVYFVNVVTGQTNHQEKLIIQ